MIASDEATLNLTLPAVQLRALARRMLVPALAGLAVGAFLLAGHGHLGTVTDALRRALHANPAWVLAGVAFEGLSLAAYVALLSLVAGRASERIGLRESAQITLAGAAATRLLPTAGAGGAALTVWTLRRAGLRSGAAVSTLLTFFVLLYAIFLGGVVVAGAWLGLGGVRGPEALALGSAGVALLAVAACLALAALSAGGARGRELPVGPSRVRRGAGMLGVAVHRAVRLLAGADVRLAGALGYWLFDAAVLVAMLHAFGTPPALPVIALAYLLGQVANTIPLPGSVSGGMAGVLIAFHVPAGLALPAVLAYRTIAVWLPTPPALGAIPALRRTVARWSREAVAAGPAA